MGDNWYEYGDFVMQKRLQEAANFTVGCPSYPWNINNTKMQ